MKANVLEEKKDNIVIEIEGARHTIPNLLREALWEESSVNLASYEKKHPILGNPKLIVNAKDPKKAVLSAIKKTESSLKEFESEFESAVK